MSHFSIHVLSRLAQTLCPNRPGIRLVISDMRPLRRLKTLDAPSSDTDADTEGRYYERDAHGLHQLHVFGRNVGREVDFSTFRCCSLVLLLFLSLVF